VDIYVITVTVKMLKSNLTHECNVHRKIRNRMRAIKLERIRFIVVFDISVSYCGLVVTALQARNKHLFYDTRVPENRIIKCLKLQV